MNAPPHLKILYQHPDQLRPDPRNARAHSKRHIKQLAKSIDAFGFNMPIGVDEENRVIAGHGRLAAAKSLNLQQVPTICLAHLDEHARMAYLVADNRLGDLSSWNDSNLSSIMLELSDLDLSFDLDAVGYSVGEINMMAAVAAPSEDKEESPPEAGPAVVATGELWELGAHLLLCESALDPFAYATLMADMRADLIVADPPYNVRIEGNVSGLGKIKHRDFSAAVGEMTEGEFIQFLMLAMRLAAGWSRNGSLHYWAMDWRHLYELTVAARAIYYEHVNTCVWTKTNPGMGSFYRSAHEFFGVWRNGKKKHRNNIELGRFGRSRSNVWSYAGANGFGSASDEGNLLALHPTVKPLALISDILLDSTQRGDVVLDPFMGSGSTLIACEKLGRRARGMEIDPAYCDVIIRRWQRWTGLQARRRSDGVLFRDLEAAAID